MTGMRSFTERTLVKACRTLVKAGYAEHLLTVPAGDSTLRLLPPLNIPDEDIAEAAMEALSMAGALTEFDEYDDDDL